MYYVHYFQKLSVIINSFMYHCLYLTFKHKMSKQSFKRFLLSPYFFRNFFVNRFVHDHAGRIKKNKNWLSVVGLEVHAQINTKTKLFSGAEAKYGAPINSNVSLFDCAIPGTLPVLNQQCVEAAITTAVALNCHVNNVSEFDRKHYFYADMPSGYQITQQRLPIAVNGKLDFVVYSPAVHKTPYYKQSIIKQLQLEQDSGKSLQDEYSSGSLIDLNRAGVGLMEIVFEPDLDDGEEAAALISELVKILSVLRTCNCKMEEGSLRVDANVSVNKPGQSFGTRTEIKNLNSIRAVSRAIDYEISRQIEILENGGVIVNETRGFDSNLKKTISMRDKEAKQDYRFMPEPNLLPLRLTELNLDPSEFVSKLPVLPAAERRSLMEKYQLKLETVLQLVDSAQNLEFFKRVMKVNPQLQPKIVCNMLFTDLLGLLQHNEKIEESCVSAEKFAEIVGLLQSGVISHNASKDLLDLVYKNDPRNPKTIAIEKGWILSQNQDKLKEICRQIINTNPKLVTAYQSGKVKVFKNLTAQLDKACQNQFKMSEAVPLFRKLLDKTKIN